MYLLTGYSMHTYLSWCTCSKRIRCKILLLLRDTWTVFWKDAIIWKQVKVTCNLFTEQQPILFYPSGLIQPQVPTLYLWIHSENKNYLMSCPRFVLLQVKNIKLCKPLKWFIGSFLLVIWVSFTFLTPYPTVPQWQQFPLPIQLLQHLKSDAEKFTLRSSR